MEIFTAFQTALESAPLPGKHRLASANTRAAYLRDLRLFVTWFCQTNGLDEAAFQPHLVTREDVRDYVAHLRLKGMAVSTIHRKHAALSAFFRWALAQGMTPADPTDGVALPRQQELAPKGLSRPQRRALLRALNRPPKNTPTARLRAVRDRALVITLLYTGLRVSEVIALRLGDLRLKPRSGELDVRGGKGDKDRTVAVLRDARQALREWLDVRPACDHDVVFTGAKAPFRPLTARAVQLVLKQVADASGLARDGVILTPHVLRHTAVYLWKEHGVDPFVIAAQFGHKSIQTTMRYGKPGLRDLHRAAARLDGDLA